MDTLKILIDSLLLKQPEGQADYVALLITYGFPVIATLLGTLLGFWLSAYLNRTTYKNDYYKKIIDKRMKVYEQLENVIRLITAKNETPDRKQIYHVIFKDFESFTNFYFEFMKAGQMKYWFSLELYFYHYDLNKDLNEIMEELSKDPTNSINIGLKHYNQIVNHGLKLTYFLVTDLKKLYNVKDFLDNLSQISKNAVRNIKDNSNSK